MRGRILCGVVAVALLGCADAPPPTEPEYAVPVYSQRGENGAGAGSLATHLSGGEEVPARQTRAQGQARFQLSPDGTQLRYKLIVAIENVTQAHIHLGAFGTNGPIVVWLYPSAPPAQHIPGRTTGVLAEGVIDDADVIGLLAGQGVAGLLEQIAAGSTYVNVHTTLYPPGEIRGQLD